MENLQKNLGVPIGNLGVWEDTDPSEKKFSPDGEERPGGAKVKTE